MAVRDIIEINEELCDGCGDCVSSCAEGAIQVIDGKARLVKDSYCDGLGACLGTCPTGALTVIRRESDAFDEEAVQQHLATLKTDQGAASLPMTAHPAGPAAHAGGGGCPGSMAKVFASAPATEPTGEHEAPQLRQWPIQLHLVPPTAPFYQDADVLLAADCVPFSLGGFHGRFLHGRSLAIACPKLDSNQEMYLQKLVAMIDEANIRKLTVMIMEVPCCGGLMRLAEQAVATARRKIPVTCIVVGLQGQIVAENEVA